MSHGILSVLVVAVVVGLTSGVAWLVARGLGRNAPLRHRVLVSALFACLLAPVVVAACGTGGAVVVIVPRLGSGPTPVATPPAPGASPIVAPAFRPPLIDPGPTPAPAPVREIVPEPVGGMIPVPTPPVWEQPAAIGRRVSIAEWMVGAWAAGTILLLARLARNVRAVVRLRRAATPLPDGRLDHLLQLAARRLGMRPGSVRLLGTDRPMAPVAVALGRPAVILPRRWLGAIGDDALCDILVHELAHLRRGDAWMTLVQELARALYWPIVPVHGLDRELRRVREELCDNAVLADGDPIRYAATLLEVARLIVAAPTVRGTVGIIGGPGPLERRIAGMLDPRRNRATRIGRAASIAIPLSVLGGMVLVSAIRLSAPARAAQAEPETVVSATTEAPTPSTPKNRPSGVVILRGHVFGPDDRPVAGARLHLSVTEWEESTELGTTDAAGAYRSEVPESALRRTLSPNFVFADSNAALLVTAPGLGSGWAELHTLQGSSMGDPSPEYAHDFHLGADAPITGQIVDLAGKPVAGAWVAVDQLYELAGRRWHKMSDAIRSDDLNLMNRQETDPAWWAAPLYPRAWGILARATTDPDGRFVLGGVGRNRVVRLKVAGPGVSSETLSVLTRDDATGFADAVRRKFPKARPRPRPEPGPAVKGEFVANPEPGVRLFGPTPLIEVEPARTVTGVVRDGRTGDPIANFAVGWGAARTDRQGWYHFVRNDDDPSLLIYSDLYKTDRYLITTRRFDGVGEAGDVRADLSIPRGVTLHGRVLEAGTNRPIVSAPRQGCHDVQPGPMIAGNVMYYPLSNNTALRGSPIGLYFEGVPRGSQNCPLHAAIDGDGRFQLAVPPGPGVLLVQARPGLPMMAEVLIFQESEGYHRLFPYAPLQIRTPDDGAPGTDPASFPGFVGPVPVSNHHAARVIDPAADATDLDITIVIPRAPTRTLRFVGPDGHLVTGVTVKGLTTWPLTVRFEGSEVEVSGLSSGVPRLVSVESNDGKLTGSFEVRITDSSEPRTVHLAPTGFGDLPPLNQRISP